MRDYAAGLAIGRLEGYKQALKDLSYPVKGIGTIVPQERIGCLYGAFKEREEKEAKETLLSQANLRPGILPSKAELIPKAAAKVTFKIGGEEIKPITLGALKYSFGDQTELQKHDPDWHMEHKTDVGIALIKAGYGHGDDGDDEPFVPAKVIKREEK